MLNFKNINRSATPYLLVIDLLMVLLVLFNLTWIIFDALFSVSWIQLILNFISPQFTTWYSTIIHPNFINYDLIFVVIYLIEFHIGWLLSAITQRYQRWFYYPFIHWYDLLGCIPIGSFRFLRVLRIISIAARLQRIGVLDIKKVPLYNTFIKYYNIIVEEVSDRVVVNVLNGTQEELKRSQDDVFDRILSDILIPQQQVLVDASLKHISHTALIMLHNHQDDLKLYIETLVHKALTNNSELKRIGWLPIVGNTVNSQLDNAISDIVNSIVNDLIKDIASPKMRDISGEIVNHTLTSIEHHGFLNDKQSIEVVNDIIEIIKEQVKVQRWREQHNSEASQET